MKRLIEQIKKDIKDYKKGIIKKLPTNKEYSEIFGVSYESVNGQTKRKLSEEEKAYRRSELQKQEGGKSWENKTEEQKQSYRDMASDNIRNSLLSEEMQKAALESEGWNVERLFRKEKVEGLGWRTFFRYAELQDFLKGTAKEKFTESLLAKLQELTSQKYKLPDFICKRKGFVMFSEVKNSKYLNNPEEVEQTIAIKDIWDSFGIETELVNHHIDLKDIEKFAEERGLNEVFIEEDEKGELSFHATPSQ